MNKVMQSISESYCVGYNFHFVGMGDPTPDLDTSSKENYFDSEFGKIVQHYLNNPDMDLDNFLDTLPIDSSLNDTDKCFLYLYAKALYLVSKDNSRVQIWDALFESDEYLNKDTYKVVLNSYYEYPPYKEDKDFNKFGFVLQSALYDFWHNTPFIRSLKKNSLNCNKSELLGSIAAIQQREYYNLYLAND